MQDKTSNQAQGNKNQHQDQKLPEQKKEAPDEKAITEQTAERDEDGDEDENHYDDSIK